MWSTLLKIGPISIYSYGLMIAIGFLLALYLATREFAKRGIDPQLINNIGFWALLFGIIGARLLHIIMFPGSYSLTDPIGWIAIWRGGLVFQGALPLPIIWVWYAMRKNNIDFWMAFDISATYIPLAHAFGRIGCFLNGCCYGRVTDVCWAVSFPRVPYDVTQSPTGSPAYIDHIHRYSELSPTVDQWSLPVHPTQLYGAFGLLALFGILLLLRAKWNPFRGFVLPTYLALYGIGRFIVEMYRGDNNPMFGWMSEQQVFSLVFVAFGVAMFFYLRRRNKTASA